MLLSLPEYLDTQFQLEKGYQQFFAYLNLLLSLPVVLYAATEYYQLAWRHLRKGLLSMDVPIVLGITALFGRSAFEIISQSGAGYMDSLTGLVFFLLVGKWYQQKTYQALSYERDYQSYFPVAVTKLIEDQEVSVLLKDIVPGDRLLVRHQELIPADAILIEGEAMIDYSFVTGEALPVAVQPGTLLYAGGRQSGGRQSGGQTAGGSLIVEVKKPVAGGYLTQLWNRENDVHHDSNALTNLTDRVGKNFTIAVLGIALATTAYWWLNDPSQIVNTVTAVLIVACPCALALTVPFTFGHALRTLGKKGLYLKNTDTVERIARIKEIVFDKTGTLTLSTLQQPIFHGKALSDEEKLLVCSAARNSTHPLSQALYQTLSLQRPSAGSNLV